MMKRDCFVDRFENYLKLYFKNIKVDTLYRYLLFTEKNMYLRKSKMDNLNICSIKYIDKECVFKEK